MSKPITDIDELKNFVKGLVADFKFEIIGFATKQGKILPLNLEPGTLGNIIEGALIAHINEKTKNNKSISITEGGFRYFPDLELTGSLTNNKLLALDIKAARRNAANPNRTQSRITLYTFGTYLKYHDKKFPQAIRPFKEYTYHLDLIAIFDVDAIKNTVGNFEILVIEPWKIASKTASSATRDYVGAIMEINKMREENGGEFKTQKDFYNHWSKILRRGEKKSSK